MSRRYLDLLLVLLATVLLVPLAFAAVPALVESARGGHPPRQSVVPGYRSAPSVLTPRNYVSVPGAGAPLPEPAALAGLLDPVLELDGPGRISAAVVDAATGQVLYDRGAAEAQLPASNLKILTAAAAVSSLGATTRLQTTVEGSGTTVVLKGGGDVLLAAGESDPASVNGYAGLATLADQTVRSLTDRAVAGPVTVELDDSLFTGPALSDAWGSADIEAGEIAPVHSLALNSAWVGEAGSGRSRAPDPGLAAAQAFRDSLAEYAGPAGIEVAAEVSRVSGPAGADRVQLAAVESAMVAEQVQYMLETSDNYLAEALGRLTAGASGGERSSSAATEAVLAAVAGLGVDTAGMVLADTSGLAGGNLATPAQLTEVTRLALTEEDAGLRAVAAGLPVAALTGTLGGRFTSGADAAGAGVVRAKTGTLLAVTSLSGYVTDADGRVLAFTFIANGLDGNTAAARAAVDAAAAVLAECGCRAPAG